MKIIPVNLSFAYLNIAFHVDQVIPEPPNYKDINFNLEYQQDFEFHNSSDSEHDRGFFQHKFLSCHLPITFFFHHHIM